MPLHHIGYFKKKPDRDPLTVSDYLSKIMFDVPRPNHRLDPVFVIADDSDAKIGNRQTATDKAWMVIERFKKEGYNLFIDQRRMPHRGKFAYTKTCVVARSYQDAIGVVTNKGKPKTVYIEESQSGTSHKAFKDWLDENHPSVTYLVHDEYVPKPTTVKESA
mgnify:CR=1 FL=1